MFTNHEKKLLKIVSVLFALFVFAFVPWAAWTQSASKKGTPALDLFGISKMNLTVSGGREWFSKWDNGHARSFKGEIDPDDPEFDTNHGDGRYEIDGKGVLKISGRTPRMYVYDPAGRKSWCNVEVTLYGMRVKESEAVGYAGLMAYARTDHRVDDHTCDDRGYGGRLTYDGRADFEKEIAHHVSNGGYVQAEEVRPWPQRSAMPKNVWIGYKFIVRDADHGTHAHMEIWRDMTDGMNGGKWELLTQYTDRGGWGKGAPSCAPGMDPTAIYTGAHPVVYLRTDKVEDMRYKKFSIREIAPLP